MEGGLRDPQRVLARYDIDQLPGSEIELLEAIARKRGCIVSGGRVDLEKVSRLLISEFRAGELGGICMETPAGLAAELERTAIEKERKAAEKEARRARRRNKKK